MRLLRIYKQACWEGELQSSTRLLSAKWQMIPFITLGAVAGATIGAMPILYEWAMALVLASVLSLWAGIVSMSATIGAATGNLFLSGRPGGPGTLQKGWKYEGGVPSS